MAKKELDGKALVKLIKELYPDGNVTPERVDYVISMSNPINYLLRNHKVKGHPVTFDIPNYDYSRAVGHRPWQKEVVESIVNPNIKEVNVEKSRQLGFSEVGVEALIYFLDYYSYDSVNALYTFPTYKAMKDHTKSRIRPEFESGYYGTLLDKDNLSLDQMSIRSSRVFFRSGSKPGNVEGVAINAAFLDEYDRYAETPAESSIIESMKSDDRYGLIRRWSTPSAPEFGVDARFMESDQRYWMIKCEHCGFWQAMDFEKNVKVLDEAGIDRMARIVKPGSTAYVCQKCGKNLEASRWYNAEWVPKLEERSRNGGARGYRISQMDAVWITSDRIYQDSLTNSKQWFYNYTLGTPFADENAKIYAKDILNHRRKDLETSQSARGDYAYLSVGIDWGQHEHHLVFLGMRANGQWDILRLARVKTSIGIDSIENDLHRVIQLIAQYNPDIVCADIGLTLAPLCGNAY
ncbi:hypothetical protein GPK34_00895 [Secundilactobacillus kimchicus]|uniref:phage terminase large subunit family protein n=1 Tax=Secundilactobacillus kimchicus TaxID=528209 RepID=UPI001C02288B|nr:phage terminase large subunit family protein [Secundilactobacillus kimchicus]MBT9670596.1 hypothetical protein [Secundilactobacillus kimchicus]